MSVIYTERYLFTDIPRDNPRSDGWTLDCGGKQDFDPSIVRLSSRVYPDGMHISSVIVGGDTYVIEGEIMKAGSVAEAQTAVEKWSAEQADKIIAAVKAAYAKEEPNVE